MRSEFAKLSTEVETQSKDGCVDAVDTRPTVKPVTNFSAGQAICVVTSSPMSSSGVALLVVTSAPDSDGTLGLRLTYWS